MLNAKHEIQILFLRNFAWIDRGLNKQPSALEEDAPSAAPSTQNARQSFKGGEEIQNKSTLLSSILQTRSLLSDTPTKFTSLPFFSPKGYGTCLYEMLDFLS